MHTFVRARLVERGGIAGEHDMAERHGDDAAARRHDVEPPADALPVRFQLQMHKFVWPQEQRGV